MYIKLQNASEHWDIWTMYTLSEVTGSIYNILPPLKTNTSLKVDGWKMLEDEMSFHHNSFIGDMRSFSGGNTFDGRNPKQPPRMYRI